MEYRIKKIFLVLVYNNSYRFNIHCLQVTIFNFILCSKIQLKKYFSLFLTNIFNKYINISSFHYVKGNLSCKNENKMLTFNDNFYFSNLGKK